jgi:hypothetical protein
MEILPLDGVDTTKTAVISDLSAAPVSGAVFMQRSCCLTVFGRNSMLGATHPKARSESFYGTRKRRVPC